MGFVGGDVVIMCWVWFETTVHLRRAEENVIGLGSCISADVETTLIL